MKFNFFKSNFSRDYNAIYRIALILIGILLTFGQFYVQRTLSEQTKSYQKIRYLEELKNRSTRLSKQALALQFSTDKKEFSETSRQFGKVLWDIKIFSQNELGIKILKSEKISLDSLFSFGEKVLLEESSSEKLLNFTQELINIEKKIRNQLELQVEILELNTHNSLNFFQWTEFILYLVILLVLYMEGKFIFKPAISQLTSELARRRSLMASIGHEVRNPMNIVLGLGEYLLKTALTFDQKETLNRIMSSSRGLVQMLDNLILSHKVEVQGISKQKIEFSLYKILEQVISLLVAGTYHKGIDVEIDISPTVPEWLEGDETKLLQVLTNLASNAIKFTHQGKIILHVSVKRIEVNQVFLKFSLKDYGQGIPQNKLHEIFHSFVQEREHFSGSGLGLYLSSTMVQSMGGKLRVNSELHRGSEFFLVYVLQ